MDRLLYKHHSNLCWLRLFAPSGAGRIYFYFSGPEIFTSGTVPNWEMIHRWANEIGFTVPYQCEETQEFGSVYFREVPEQCPFAASAGWESMALPCGGTLELRRAPLQLPSRFHSPAVPATRFAYAASAVTQDGELFYWSQCDTVDSLQHRFADADITPLFARIERDELQRRDGIFCRQLQS